MEQHYLQSSYREKLIEHLFIGELLKYSWHQRACALEIARPEVDNCGYDVIATERDVIRHIQLKASLRNAKAASQKVQMALGTKPSGCVVWIICDPESLALGPFLFFGDIPGAALPALSGYKVARQTKPNSQGVKSDRPRLRVVPKSRFQTLGEIGEIYLALFGPSAGADLKD